MPPTLDKTMSHAPSSPAVRAVNLVDLPAEVLQRIWRVLAKPFPSEEWYFDSKHRKAGAQSLLCSCRFLRDWVGRNGVQALSLTDFTTPEAAALQLHNFPRHATLRRLRVGLSNAAAGANALHALLERLAAAPEPMLQPLRQVKDLFIWHVKISSPDTLALLAQLFPAVEVLTLHGIDHHSFLYDAAALIPLHSLAHLRALQLSWRSHDKCPAAFAAALPQLPPTLERLAILGETCPLTHADSAAPTTTQHHQLLLEPIASVTSLKELDLSLFFHWDVPGRGIPHEEDSVFALLSQLPGLTKLRLSYEESVDPRHEDGKCLPFQSFAGLAAACPHLRCLEVDAPLNEAQAQPLLSKPGLSDLRLAAAGFPTPSLYPFDRSYRWWGAKATTWCSSHPWNAGHAAAAAGGGAPGLRLTIGKVRVAELAVLLARPPAPLAVLEIKTLDCSYDPPPPSVSGDAHFARTEAEFGEAARALAGRGRAFLHGPQDLIVSAWQWPQRSARFSDAWLLAAATRLLSTATPARRGEARLVLEHFTLDERLLGSILFVRSSSNAGHGGAGSGQHVERWDMDNTVTLKLIRCTVVGLPWASLRVLPLADGGGSSGGASDTGGTGGTGGGRAFLSLGGVAKRLVCLQLYSSSFVALPSAAAGGEDTGEEGPSAGQRPPAQQERVKPKEEAVRWLHGVGVGVTGLKYDSL